MIEPVKHAFTGWRRRRYAGASWRPAAKGDDFGAVLAELLGAVKAGKAGASEVVVLPADQKPWEVDGLRVALCKRSAGGMWHVTPDEPADPEGCPSPATDELSQ